MERPFGAISSRDARRAAGRQSVIAGLDVGSSKVTCFIARREAQSLGGESPLRVIGIGHQSSRGVKAGSIVDMEAAEGAIRAAVEQAERMAGVTLRGVHVSIACGAPASHNLNVEVDIAGHEIGDQDLRHVIRTAKARSVFEGHEVVHSAPVAYAIDGHRGITDPRGMFGERLGVTMHVVTANPSPIRNLELCIERCHLEVFGKALAPWASGVGALAADERDLGVTIVDMGGGTTSLAVFFGGNLMYTDVLPVGGHHITTDIARGLSTTVAQAERLKTLHGSALSGPHDHFEAIPVSQVGEEDSDGHSQVSRSVLTGIIRPRIEETFELVRDRLAASGYHSIAGRRVVLTGGGSQLNGARELAGQVLSKQVRLGRPMRLAGLAEATGGAPFSVCAGLVLSAAGARANRDMEDQTNQMTWPTAKIAGLGRWLRAQF
jgi:cell division protein FtsA